MTGIFNWKKEWASEVETTFHLRSNSLISPAGINPGAADIYGPLAQVFIAQIPVAHTNRREWQQIEAFFAKVGGVSGLVRMFDPKHPRPGRDLVPPTGDQAWSDGTFFSDGTGWVNSFLPPYISVYEAAPAGATSFVAVGLTPSESPSLWAGDRMEIMPSGVPVEFGHYYMATNDAPSDTLGRTRIDIAPALRMAIAAGDQVQLHWPTSVFRLVDDEQGKLAHLLGGVAGTGFGLIEVLPS